MTRLIDTEGDAAERAGDPLNVRFVLGLPPESLLGTFNAAGILAPADVHVARVLARLGDEEDETVILATALAVRAPRVGHVRVELGRVRETVASDTEEDIDIDIDGLPWPADLTTWLEAIRRSPLVTDGPDARGERPLRLVGDALYLDRHWRDEQSLAACLLARVGTPPPELDMALLSDGLKRLFPGVEAGEQRWAASAAALGLVAVVAGGPGTGKTTTIPRLVALLDEQARASGDRPPLVALCAPTGKAAARMQESVRAQAADLDAPEDTRQRLEELNGFTIHRLLGTQPGNGSRFRHNRDNRLPHEVVIVDETSMVSSSLMARLLEALRPDARLVLVGDPEQLVSVEAGAVLADMVGPAATGMRMSPSAAARLEAATGAVLPTVAADGPGIGDGVILLRRNYRFRGALAELAGAVQTGDADLAIEVLTRRDPAVGWLAVDLASVPEGGPAEVRRRILEWGGAVRAAAVAGDKAEALAALGRLRVLCAHRRGPAGVSVWNRRIEEWLGEAEPDRLAEGSWYRGRPVMVTVNDYSLRLFNGDTGVSVAGAEGRPEVVFDRRDEPVGPSRLSSVDTVYATTIHKSQGSEFGSILALLPEPTSRLLTRELLYTAVTRAMESVLVVGTEESVRRAVSTPIARASGLSELLWGAPG